LTKELFSNNLQQFRKGKSDSTIGSRILFDRGMAFDSVAVEFFS